MKWWGWLICCILIFVGTFCLIDNVKYLTAGNKTYGKYKYVPNNYQSLYKQDLISMALTDENNDGYYTYVKTFDAREFNGLSKNYELRVNDLPCYSTTVNAGSIISVFKTDLRNVDNEITSSISLNITVEFLASGTRITIGLNNDNNQLFAFEEWLFNNGFTVEVLEVAYE